MVQENLLGTSEETMASLLGVPLFSTRWYVPKYRPMEGSQWRVTECPFHLERGYHSGTWAVGALPILMRRAAHDQATWQTWMSFSPQEIESQELACTHAHGHMVVMGLGLAWVAINMAFQRAVTRVTVVERDMEVIQLLDVCSTLSDIPLWVRTKIRIVKADALEWRPDLAVDVLYADIWRTFDEPGTLQQVQQMQANVQADSVYFWGQEIVLAHLLGETSWQDLPAADLRQRIQAVSRLPLLVPEHGYAQMIRQVMENRRLHVAS
ncbi:hypothetical protein [Uliginosibacterium gangwonense]|uniref:hypothetical protein n=1 Tax=Uliginosibacterium gangwonense TaxID=392736 RepID=UPI000378CD1B|nr:hypothetical protein [Uliginosibacterium gangwonense]